MKNQLIKYVYNGSEVEFDLTTQRVWVNATQMVKICGKRINDYLESKSAREFTQALVNRLNRPLDQPNSHYRNLGIDDPKTDDKSGLHDGNFRFEQLLFTDKDVIKVIRGGNKPGTWMDRIQALHFAAWLDPEFAVWVYMTIDAILFEQQRVEETKLSEMAENEIRRRELEDKFAKNDEYRELQKLRGMKSQYLGSPKQQAEVQLELFLTKTQSSN